METSEADLAEWRTLIKVAEMIDANPAAYKSLVEAIRLAKRDPFWFAREEDK